MGMQVFFLLAGLSHMGKSWLRIAKSKITVATQDTCLQLYCRCSVSAHAVTACVLLFGQRGCKHLGNGDLNR